MLKIKGFSLIEMLIVVAIIGLLAAIALPNYNAYVSKSRRSDAKSALLAAAQAMEKFYTENSTYLNAGLGTAATDVAKTTSVNGYYTLGFDPAPTSTTVCGGTLAVTSPSASAYRLCATPTGVQSADSCGVMSYSSSGAKSPTTGCW